MYFLLLLTGMMGTAGRRRERERMRVEQAREKHDWLQTDA